MTAISVDQAATISTALQAATRRLDTAGVDAPRIVAEALLAQTLELSRAQLLARLEASLPADKLGAYDALLHRCEAGEPLAYVLGHREFYALNFLVDARVLIPRPETELLIETAILIAQARSETAPSAYTIADIGTGSGAIAITLAVHLPQARVIATDISPDAIAVASQNARRHGVSDRVDFRIGDLLEVLDAPVDLLAANLPYVRSKEWEGLAHSIRGFEPAVAFDGGSDGLDMVNRLLRGAPSLVRTGGSVLLEIGASHGEAAIELARDYFPDANIAVEADYAGRERLLIIQTCAA